MRHYTLVVAIGLALMLGACATPQPDTSPSAAPAAGSSPTSAPAGHGEHGVTEADAPFDAQFIDSMIIHHQGAIEMAEAALVEAEHQEVRDMAEAIIDTQTREIAQMQEWRGAWYPDLAPTVGMDMEMGDMAISDDTSKPFDQRFLEAMISHHVGALHMAEMAVEQAEQEELRTLAEAIIAAQEAEIEQMQGWLEEWYGVVAGRSPALRIAATARLATPQGTQPQLGQN